MATRKRKDLGGYTEGANSDGDILKRRVGYNHEALTSLALHSPVDIVESFYRQTRKAVKRLGLSNGPVFAQIDAVGTYPSVLDLMRWLDSIEKKTRSHRRDRIFLASLNATLESRLPPSAIKKIQEEEKT